MLVKIIWSYTNLFYSLFQMVRESLDIGRIHGQRREAKVKATGLTKVTAALSTIKKTDPALYEL